MMLQLPELVSLCGGPALQLLLRRILMGRRDDELVSSTCRGPGFGMPANRHEDAQRRDEHSVHDWCNIDPAHPLHARRAEWARQAKLDPWVDLDALAFGHFGATRPLAPP